MDVGGGVFHHGGVGHNLPARRGGNGHCVGGFDVRLVEAGEYALGVGGFELGVQVGFLICGVGEAVQALAGAGVFAVGDNPQGVFAGGEAQSDAMLRRVGGGGVIDGGAIQDDFADASRT